MSDTQTTIEELELDTEERPAIRQLMTKAGFKARSDELGISPQELHARMLDGRHADWRPLRGVVDDKWIPGSAEYEAECEIDDDAAGELHRRR